MAAVRDFDSAQLQADYDGILAQAGVTFTYFGTTVTGIWSSSRNMFDEFSEQRREEEKFTVFFTTNQVVTTPKQSQTCARSGITYFIEQVRFDTEGTGCEFDICRDI